MTKLHDDVANYTKADNLRVSKEVTEYASSIQNNVNALLSLLPKLTLEYKDMYKLRDTLANINAELAYTCLKLIK